MNIPPPRGHRRGSSTGVRTVLKVAAGWFPGLGCKRAVSERDAGFPRSGHSASHVMDMAQRPKQHTLTNGNSTMLKVVRTDRKREIYLDNRRIFLATIGSDSLFGECTIEAAEKGMQKCLNNWGLNESDAEPSKEVAPKLG